MRPRDSSRAHMGCVMLGAVLLGCVNLPAAAIAADSDGGGGDGGASTSSADASASTGGDGDGAGLDIGDVGGKKSFGFRLEDSGLSLGTRGSASGLSVSGITEAISNLEPSERRRLTIRCRQVMRSPGSYDAATVAVCRVVAVR